MGGVSPALGRLATPDEDFVEKRINYEIRRLCETTRDATIVAKRTKTHPKGGNSTRSMNNFILDLILEYSIIGLHPIGRTTL